jgi:hypothetical protein
MFIKIFIVPPNRYNTHFKQYVKGNKLKFSQQICLQLFYDEKKSVFLKWENFSLSKLPPPLNVFNPYFLTLRKIYI